MTVFPYISAILSVDKSMPSFITQLNLFYKVLEVCDFAVHCLIVQIEPATTVKIENKFQIKKKNNSEL